ncbi:MAG: hypothetical protein AABY32_01835 [Nanoarchaeota archaeon]
MDNTSVLRTLAECLFVDMPKDYSFLEDVDESLIDNEHDEYSHEELYGE